METFVQNHIGLVHKRKGRSKQRPKDAKLLASAPLDNARRNEACHGGERNSNTGPNSATFDNDGAYAFSESSAAVLK